MSIKVTIIPAYTINHVNTPLSWGSYRVVGDGRGGREHVQDRVPATANGKGAGELGSDPGPEGGRVGEGHHQIQSGYGLSKSMQRTHTPARLYQHLRHDPAKAVWERERWNSGKELDDWILKEWAWTECENRKCRFLIWYD